MSLYFELSGFSKTGGEERLKRYRKYFYEAGALDRPDQNQSKVIDDKVIEKERKSDYEITRVDRFRYRIRHFIDSGIIGSKKFVSENYLKLKDLFQSKEKKPKPLKGIEGMYSLKRLVKI